MINDNKIPNIQAHLNNLVQSKINQNFSIIEFCVVANPSKSNMSKSSSKKNFFRQNFLVDFFVNFVKLGKSQNCGIQL